MITPIRSPCQPAIVLLDTPRTPPSLDRIASFDDDEDGDHDPTETTNAEENVPELDDFGDAAMREFINQFISYQSIEIYSSLATAQSNPVAERLSGNRCSIVAVAPITASHSGCSSSTAQNEDGSP